MDTVGIDLLQAGGDELLGMLVVQQHSQRCINAQNQNSELTDDIAQGINDHKEVANMVILTQFLERPVGAVGNVGVEALGALVEHSRIEHSAHGNGA